MLIVGQGFFNAKLEWLSGDTQVLDMIVFKLSLALLLLLIIDERLFRKFFIYF